MPKVFAEYKEKAKERIIIEATKEFSKKGYKATTMDSIAENLGVSKAALYQYYKSKADLFQQAIEYGIHQRKIQLNNFLNSKEFSSLSSKEFFDGYFFKLSGSRDIRIVTMAEVVENKELRAMIDNYFDQYLNWFVIIIDEMKKKGMISTSIDSRKFSVKFAAIAGGIKGLMLVGVPKDELEMVWHELIDDLLN
jgi:AcrR family transcriptional regulator